MKNAVIFGIIIGVLSGLWVWMMYLLGYSPYDPTPAFGYFSVIIPFIGVYFGVRRYRTAKSGSLSFFEGAQEGFKILIIGGIIAVFFGIVYISYVSKGSISDFAGKIFGAMLVGVIAVLASALLLMTTSRRIDSAKQ